MPLTVYQDFQDSLVISLATLFIFLKEFTAVNVIHSSVSVKLFATCRWKLKVTTWLLTSLGYLKSNGQLSYFELNAASNSPISLKSKVRKSQKQ